MDVAVSNNDVFRVFLPIYFDLPWYLAKDVGNTPAEEGTDLVTWLSLKGHSTEPVKLVRVAAYFRIQTS